MRNGCLTKHVKPSSYWKSTLVPPAFTTLPHTKTLIPRVKPIPLPECIESVSLKTGNGFDLAGFLQSPQNMVAEPIAMLLAYE